MTTINETTVDSLIQFFVAANDGSTYGFSDTGKVFSIAGSTDDPVVSLKYTNTNGKIRGASVWGISDGGSTSTYLFWSTDTSIARKLLPGDDAWGDVSENWRATLDGADWHTMMPASGYLMVANREYLASIDYVNDGTFNNAAMNIRPGNLIKAIEERDDTVILGSYRTDNEEEGHLWAWQVTATNWIQKKRIPIKGVNAMINAELMLMQGGSDGELLFSDFVNAVPLHAIPGKGEVLPGATAIQNKLAMFGVSTSDYPGIWSYGRTKKNRPFALNYEYRLAKTVAGSSVSTVGAISVVNGNMFASWGTTDGSTSDYGVDMVSATTRANAIYEGLEFDQGLPAIKKIIDTVKLNMVELPSGTSVSVKFKTNKQSAWQYAVLGSGSTTFSESGQNEVIFSIGAPAMVWELGVDLTASGSSTPEVLAITGYLANERYEF